MYTIIHNPRCSKSRETLEILREHTNDIKIINYLQGELTAPLLKEIIRGLGVPPREILRTKEDIFSTLKLNLDDDHSVEAAILAHPQLLERPIVIKGKKAIIGRPPEKVHELL